MTHLEHNLAPLEAGRRALVLGLGRTGVSCARYLRRKGSRCGWRTRAVNRRVPRRCASRCRTQNCARVRSRDDLLDGVAQVVISPGLSLREPVAVEARLRGLPVAGDIELFARRSAGAGRGRHPAPTARAR